MSKKIHAQHNEKVCELLKDKGCCPDWVVTTAFYSGLHYVQHEIFPYNDGNRNYPTFDNYYNGYKFNGKRPTRHQVTIDLVFEVLQECGDSYKFLFENSQTARYHNYKIPVQIADKAILHLNTIKTFLVK